MAKETFSAMAKSIEGLKVSCTSRNFEFILDEPKSLGGSDEGMNPVADTIKNAPTTKTNIHIL